jgi:hypothetical protein
VQQRGSGSKSGRVADLRFSLTFADLERIQIFSGRELGFCGDFKRCQRGEACGKTWSMDKTLIGVAGWGHVSEGA